MQADELRDDTEGSTISTAATEKAARRSTWVSVCVNVLLSCLQIAVGILAKSQGLIADGIHSLSDLIADFVVLIANRHSGKVADVEHPYGHQRFETAASFILGGLLLVVGCGMLWSAIIKLENHADIPPVHIAALWIAVTALIAKESLFRYMLAIATKVKSGMLVANAWHARSDAASSLVVGAGIIGNLLGYPLLDPVAALIVGLMVGKMGWGFAWRALNDLMDAAADDEEVAAIRRTILETRGLKGAHDLRTRKMGDLIVVDVHLEIDANLTVAQGHEIALDARNSVMKRHRVLNVMTHVDPVPPAA